MWVKRVMWYVFEVHVHVRISLPNHIQYMHCLWALQHPSIHHPSDTLIPEQLIVHVHGLHLHQQYLWLHIFLHTQALPALSQCSIQCFIASHILTGKVISWKKGDCASKGILRSSNNKGNPILLMWVNRESRSWYRLYHIVYTCTRHSQYVLHIDLTHSSCLISSKTGLRILSAP